MGRLGSGGGGKRKTSRKKFHKRSPARDTKGGQVIQNKRSRDEEPAQFSEAIRGNIRRSLAKKHQQ